MTLATSLRTAARSLINTFGNSASLYSYSGATKTENTEGDMTVSDWKTATTITVVDGPNVKEVLEFTSQGMESLGDDEKLVRDDVTIVINDRITADSIEYRVVEIRPIRTQSTVVVYVIRVSRMDQTTAW